MHHLHGIAWRQRDYCFSYVVKSLSYLEYIAVISNVENDACNLCCVTFCDMCSFEETPNFDLSLSRSKKIETGFKFVLNKNYQNLLSGFRNKIRGQTDG
jgi:hypothetical protein